MNRTVHLAYTVPFSPHLLRRGLDRVIRMAHMTPLYRSANEWLVPWQHPVRAPHSITYNLINAIQEYGFNVRLYSLYEHGVAEIHEGDIFIGQPLPLGGHGKSRSQVEDIYSITSRTIREFPSANNFIIMPYSHDPQYSLFWKQLLKHNLSAGGGVILVGGEIWGRDWETRSPLGDLGAIRKLHVRMAIDPVEYPFVKKTFNPAGKRRYLYIGHTAWYKNTIELERIAARMKGFEFVHIGAGKVEGWKKRADFAKLTPKYAAQLAEEFDVFVNVSSGDPQATAVLEQMCFGIPIACTPETGYEYPSIIRLSTNDTDFNCRQLMQIQSADEESLFQRTRQNRALALEFHNWKKFTSDIMSFML